MSEMKEQSRPVVILSCQIFQHWLENLLPDEWVKGITFFDYGLHAVPKNLRQTIQNAIDCIDQPSLILLGYGLCGNGLSNINSGKHFLLIPRSDDCIGILLGSYQAYLNEIRKEPGTYYLSKGWLEGGSNPLEESLKYEKKYGKEKAAWLMDTQYHHYRRLIMVARNTQEMETYRPKAQEVADYCSRWGMRFEEMIGTDDYLERLVEIAINLDKLDDEFILVPPGSVLTQAMFMRQF